MRTIVPEIEYTIKHNITFRQTYFIFFLWSQYFRIVNEFIDGLLYLFISQGNGHYFPLKNQSSESHNPLLANEDIWEESDDGSEAESQSKI